MFTFLTQVLTFDVCDRQGAWIGHPCDFLAKFDEAYPRFTHLVVTRGKFRKKYFVIPWNEVQVVHGKSFQIRKNLKQLEAKSSYREVGVPSICRDILDQQVVDTFNRKVVRVNDLHFLSIRDEYRLVNVDVGFRGLVRRLGFEKILDQLVRIFNQHAEYLTERDFISWKYIQPLSIFDTKGGIQLNVEQQALRDIPPSDISEMLLELDPHQRAALVRSLDIDTQVQIITELDLKLQKDLIEDLDVEAAARLLEMMPADEATDLLQQFSRTEANHLLAKLSTRKARQIRELMQHETDSAGGLMTKEFITLAETMTVGEAIELVRKDEARAETIHCLYVVDRERKLVGSVLIRELLLEPNEVTMSEVMQRKPPCVFLNDSLKDVAFVFDKYNSFVMPVIDDDEVLQGIVTIDDIFTRAVKLAYGEQTGL